MAIFNVKSGYFRNLPANIFPGTFYVSIDEDALYCDLTNPEDENESFRVRIGDFQIFETLEDLKLNSNKSPHALYYIKPKKNEHGIEVGNVLAKYDEVNDTYYQINTDTGMCEVEVIQVSSLPGRANNLLTDVNYNPDTRKLTLTLGKRASTQEDFDNLKSQVNRIDGDINTVDSIKYQINQEKIRAIAAETRAQNAADHAQADINDLKSGEFTDLSEDVQVLLGSDKSESNRATKSIRTIANEELATQLITQDAKEALDTLQEIANWIQQHPDDAAAMNTAIQNLKTYVGNIPSSAYSADVVNYISERDKAERDSYRGDAQIASIENGIVRIKTGVTEREGKISNDSSQSDIPLSRVASTGLATDVSLQNGKSVEQQFQEVNDLVQSWGSF